MDFFIGDNFAVFEHYNISKNDVLETVSKPDKRESLSLNVYLYVKSFKNNDSKRKLLLVGSQINEEREIFSFSYWIPVEYLSSTTTLLETLKLFANRFGFILEIGESRGYFLEHSTRMMYKKIDNPFDVVTINAPEQVPLDVAFFASEENIGSINRINVFYAFSINRGNYLFWLLSYPYTKIKIKKGWYDLVKDKLLQYVQPDGKSVIKLLQQRSTEHLEKDPTNEYVDIEVPDIYKDQFNYIISQINELNNFEKIIFKVSLEQPKCLFCTSSDLSKEHVFPVWLRGYVDETNLEGTGFWNFGDESLENIIQNSLTSGKKESSYGYTTNIVCRDCNNTWMSDLETKAKSILISEDKLLDSLPNDLSEPDSYNMALWLIVKAVLFSNKNFSNVHEFRQEFFNDIKLKKINPGFIVEYARANNSKFDFGVSKGVIDERMLKLKRIEINNAKEMTANFFTFSLQLNYLLFRVSYLDPKLPFDRESIIIRTKSLFPYHSKLRHQESEISEKILSDIITNKLELPFFNTALMLVEK